MYESQNAVHLLRLLLKQGSVSLGIFTLVLWVPVCGVTRVTASPIGGSVVMGVMIDGAFGAVGVDSTLGVCSVPEAGVTRTLFSLERIH